MYVLVVSNAGACDKKSNSKYPFPFATVSVVGILNIVDCAIAVCAVRANKRATNNPDRTFKFFTVFPRPFLCKKKRPAALTLSADWTPSSSEFFCRTASCGATFFVAQHGRGCQTNTSGLYRASAYILVARLRWASSLCHLSSNLPDKLRRVVPCNRRHPGDAAPRRCFVQGRDG